MASLPKLCISTSTTETCSDAYAYLTFLLSALPVGIVVILLSLIKPLPPPAHQASTLSTAMAELAEMAEALPLFIELITHNGL